jgi:hypothetical protein
VTLRSRFSVEPQGLAFERGDKYISTSTNARNFPIIISSRARLAFERGI